MKKYSLVIIALLLLATGADAQLTLNGVTLPAKVQKDNTSLMLNGGGIRKKLFFKLYTAGLYLDAKNKNAADIINADKAMVMRLTITSSVISSSNMSEAIEEGFKKSMKGNTAPLQAKIDEFINTFKKEDIKEGDTFEIWYIPGQGIKSYKNDKLQSTIPGMDFKKALFGIWFSDDPVDSDLKQGLLGS
ncbi:MAG TPA: chalcone isomerase family protein [Chitinophagales bacterium]|nr:chalcone isomerase family protein [Chitinophagales bacterium]